MSQKKYAVARVIVGELPEDYNEEQHDPIFEHHVRGWFGKVAEEVTIEYCYTSDTIVRFYDDEDNLVTERPTDLTFAFDKAIAEEW